jgi:hypothetical protein
MTIQDNPELNCPDCASGMLAIRYSCLRTYFVCNQCRNTYALDQLVKSLDEETLERIEKLVGSRLSDRL